MNGLVKTEHFSNEVVYEVKFHSLLNKWKEYMLKALLSFLGFVFILVFLFYANGFNYKDLWYILSGILLSDVVYALVSTPMLLVVCAAFIWLYYYVNKKLSFKIRFYEHKFEIQRMIYGRFLRVETEKYKYRDVADVLHRGNYIILHFKNETLFKIKHLRSDEISRIRSCFLDKGVNSKGI